MRFGALAVRNVKEIVREPISALLGLALPLFLLVLFTQIGKRLPVSVFRIENFVTGMTIFGFSFLTMFSALLLAQDKKTSFLMRLFASPLSAVDYILGFALPLLPLALIQCTACFSAAILLGLPLSWNIPLSLLALIPQAILSIFAGLLMGSLLSEKQVQGFGNIYIITGALLSGAWMDLDLLGGTLKEVSYALPFAHSNEAARLALAGNMPKALIHLLWPTAYSLLIFVSSVLAFKKIMKR